MIVIGGMNSKTGDAISAVECYCQCKMSWTQEFQPFPVPISGMVAIVLETSLITDLSKHHREE